MISAKMKSFVMVAGGALLLSAAPALAQNYDGYCYQKNSQARTKGTVIGAAGGAALGNIVAGKGNKTEGTILGGIVGGIVGNQVAKNQQNKNQSIECLHGRYYIYEDGYYDPPTAPKGYTATYFYERPSNATPYVRRNGYEYEWRPGDRRHSDDRGLRPYGQ